MVHRHQRNHVAGTRARLTLGINHAEEVSGLCAFPRNVGRQECTKPFLV
jgi:hypothetical protein